MCLSHSVILLPVQEHQMFYSTVRNFGFMWVAQSEIIDNKVCRRRSQWSRCLRHRSAAVRLLRLWVRIPPESWMFVCYECCVLSGRGLCDGLITRPEEPYRLWCVVVCDLEASWMRRPWPTRGCCAKLKKMYPEVS